jgi:protein-disulfide isomerase
MTKPVWKVFWDIQCPYSKVSWEKLPEIRERFGNEYDFEIKLTSLVFHPQAFPAQCAASLVETKKGSDAKAKFVDACFRKQDLFLNAAVGDARPSEVRAVFASIAKEEGIFDEDFTEAYFLEKFNDWEEAVKPANAEHKEALVLGIYGTPKHVIGDKGVIADTESSWGADAWAEKLKTL